VGATVSENGIFSGTDSATNSLRVEGFTPSQKDDSASSFDQVGPHYFQVIGVPLLAGRDFDEHDTAGAQPVVIVNRTMARFYFGDSNPVGKYIANGNDRYIIVGVVQDMKEHTLKGKVERRFYLPLLASNDNIGTFHFEIRTRDNAAVTIGAIRREMRSFDPRLILTNLEPATVLINQGIGGDRLIAQLSGFFGIVALLLAATGLYGVISYETVRRTNEIGLRIALGAERNDVIRMVVRETLMPITAGFAIGLPAALATSRMIAANLSGIGPSDPTTFGGAGLVLLMAALLAGFIPAVRASHVDPMTALRQE
jgi:predicted permease